MTDQLESTRISKCNPAWPVFRLKHLTRLIGGGTPAKADESFWTGGDVPWVSPKDMKTRIIMDTEDHITTSAVDGAATKYVEIGSPLIVVRSGILKHTLPVALAGCRLTLNQDMKAFVVSATLDPEFLAYWIEGQSAELLLEWRQLGATVESIDTRRMMDGRMALPSRDEQRAIVNYLDKEVAKIDQAISTIGDLNSARVAPRGSLLALLLERRSALITATVTGVSHPAHQSHSARQAEAA